MEFPGLPSLDWIGPPGEVVVDTAAGSAQLVLQAAPMTDWFNDPASPTRTATASALAFDVDGDFQFAATVSVDFAATFDAGVLVVWQGPDDWAKLCNEFDPTGQPMVVTVVTRGVSDDSNEPAIDGDTVRLRISRFGDALAFHYQRAEADGSTTWKLSRLFAMREPEQPMRVGMLAQSPTGEGCTAWFSDVVFAATTLLDARDGS